MKYFCLKQILLLVPALADNHSKDKSQTSYMQRLYAVLKQNKVVQLMHSLSTPISLEMAADQTELIVLSTPVL